MLTQLRNSYFFLMVLIEATLVAFALVAAYLVRFEFELRREQWEQIGAVLQWLIPLKMGIFTALGLYRGMWNYSSLHDAWRLAGGCLYASLSAIGIVQFFYKSADFSLAVFVLDGVLTFLLTGGARVLIRTLYVICNHRGLIVTRPQRFHAGSENPKRILIIGAGGSGEKILRETFENPYLNHHVIGFLDDDPRKNGRTVHGVRVFGAVDDLPQVIKKHRVEEVFISTPSVTGFEMGRITGICDDCGIPYRIVPSIGQIIDKKVGVRPLLDINYEDLLRRSPVRLDIAGIGDFLKGKNVLVTERVDL